MLSVRSALFTGYFFLWTFGVALLGSPFLLVSKPATMRVARLWARGTMLGAQLLCGIRWRMEGLEHLPQGGYILACQHQSAWETVVMYLAVPRPCYILKKGLSQLPLFGWYTKKIKCIAVDRSGGASALKSMVRQSVERLQQGRQVVIFPHGTRIVHGEKQPLQPGIAAMYAHAATFPIVPATLDSGRCWPKNSWRKYPGTITLRFHPAIPAGIPKTELMTQLDAVLNG